MIFFITVKMIQLRSKINIEHDFIVKIIPTNKNTDKINDERYDDQNIKNDRSCQTIGNTNG